MGGLVEHLSRHFYGYSDYLCIITGILILFVLGFIVVNGGIPKPVKKCKYCKKRHEKDECCPNKFWGVEK